jgi:hypothetical protein
LTIIIVKYPSYLETTAYNIGKVGLTGILISILTSSCSKDLPACRGNCDMAGFSINVSDFTSGQPISRQAIAVILKQNGSCWICSIYKVAEGSSDANGNFEFRKNIDTTLLLDHHIEVQLTTSDGYVTRIGPADSSWGIKYAQTRVLSFRNIDSSLDNILFKIYPKASLRLNFHRTTAIIPGREFFDLQYSFTGAESIGTAFEMTAANKDTVVLVKSAANVFTKITSGKFITYDSLLYKTDSIKCAPNADNSIDISY